MRLKEFETKIKIFDKEKISYDGDEKHVMLAGYTYFCSTT